MIGKYKRNITISIQQLIEIAVYMVLGIACSYFMPNISNRTISIFIFAVNIYGAYKARSNWYALIMMGWILYSNYSIVYANHLHPINSYFTSWAQQPVAAQGLWILLIFSIVLNLMIPRHMTQRKKCQFAIIKNNKSNKLIFLGICGLLVLIFFFGFGRPIEAGERGSPSSWYEYSLILFILGFYYSGKNKLNHMALAGLIALFALQNFVYGGRITGLQVILCWGMCVAIDRIRLSIAVPLAAVLFLVMSAIGQMRANFSLNAESLQMAFEEIAATGGTLDTAYSSYFSSLTFLKVAEFTPAATRFKLFIQWVWSIFLGGGIPDSNLSSYTQEYFRHYGGGLIPFYGYFYGGLIGLLAITILVGLWIRMVGKTDVESSGLKRCLTVYIICSSLRWYLYSPSQITRGALICVLLYGLCDWFDRFQKKP